MENAAWEHGGGMCSCTDFGVITNTILWNNTAPNGPELAVYPTLGDLTIRYSDVRGGLGACYVDPWNTLYWESGMIDADPSMVDPSSGDYHLRYDSPCRDAGDPLEPGLPTEDFEGDPRIAEIAPDMGADEFHPHLYLTGNTVPSGDVELKFIGYPGTPINGLVLGVNLYDPPLTCDYGEWNIAPPTQILFGFGVLPAEGVTLFPGTLPPTPAGPYTVYLQAVIDLWLTNLYTLNVNGP
jgi:hypothetical protein